MAGLSSPDVQTIKAPVATPDTTLQKVQGGLNPGQEKAKADYEQWKALPQAEPNAQNASHITLGQTAREVRGRTADQIAAYQKWQQDREKFWKKHGGQYELNKDGSRGKERIYPVPPPDFTVGTTPEEAEKIVQEGGLEAPITESTFTQKAREQHALDGKIVYGGTPGAPRPPTEADYDYLPLSNADVEARAKETGRTADEVRQIHRQEFDDKVRADIQRRAFPEAGAIKPGSIGEEAMKLRFLNPIPPEEFVYTPPSDKWVEAKMAENLGLTREQVLTQHKDEFDQRYELNAAAYAAKQKPAETQDGEKQKPKKNGLLGLGIWGL